jgi:hypothetical protein
MHDDYESLDETANLINADPQVRQERLGEIMKRGQKRMDKPRSKYHIAGQEFVLKKQVAEAAQFVLWGKGLVDQAVKPSAEASLIWAGICLILPLLTHPYLTAQANESGFNYVTARIDFYVTLEPLLLPENAGISEKLKEAFQKDIVDLYQYILEFQFKSVLQFYDCTLKKFAQDVRNQNIWDKMLSKVQAAEKTLTNDFKKISDAALRHKLEELDKSTKTTLDVMQQHLSVTEEQLHVNKEHLYTSSKQLQQAEHTKYALPPIPPANPSRLTP